MLHVSICKYGNWYQFFICTMLFLAGIMGDWLGYVAGGVTLTNAGTPLIRLVKLLSNIRAYLSSGELLPVLLPSGFQTRSVSMIVRRS